LVGKLCSIGNLDIRVYANDHLPPHFHAITPDEEALIEIATLKILKGSLPPRVRRTVMAWAEENKAALAAEWNRINPNFPIT
jgi:hypothetical protein